MKRNKIKWRDNEDETYEDFEARWRESTNRKNQYCTGSYGVRDYYTYYHQHVAGVKRMTREEFSDIFTRLNELTVEMLFRDSVIKLPFNMGEFTLYCNRIPAFFKENKTGRIVDTRISNYHQTMKAWYEDEDLFYDRLAVKYNSKDVFRFSIKYFNWKAKYKYKSIFMFNTSRAVKRDFVEKVLSNKILTFKKNANRELQIRKYQRRIGKIAKASSSAES